MKCLKRIVLYDTMNWKIIYEVRSGYMNMSLKSKRILGINGIGRIGKLTLWNHVNLQHFDGIVINDAYFFNVVYHQPFTIYNAYFS